ncbi:MAG TPA: hypothetical protein DCX53_10145 [Anaerolineae bacterium]|nr:hypothetical protein [Anaerolineae bacterium]
MKILYVEDELPHVELTQRALEKNFKKEFVLFHRDSLDGALKLLFDEPDIDIVLTDLRLPDGSGLDLLKQIRELPVPPAVVLVTGQGDERVAVAALKAGAADYLVKQSDYLHRLPVVITNAVAQNRFAREQSAKHDAELRYRSLIEHTPAVVFLSDVDELETPLYISPRIQELTGYSPEEWVGDPSIWRDNIHPEDRDWILERAQSSHDRKERFQEEYRFLCRNGQVIWIKEDTNLLRDEAGASLYWQGVFVDITKEKETAKALERQLKELTVLNTVTLAGAEGATEDEIIERVVNLISLIYNEAAGVLLLNEQGDILTPHPSSIGATVFNWEQGIPITQGITGKCVKFGKAIRLGDVTRDPSFIEFTTGIRSELCVPIRVNKRIIGAFNVESRKADAYDNEDEQFLTTVAGSLGTALERLRFFNEEQQRNKELNALYHSTKTLTQSLKPDVIASSLLTIMDDLLGYEFASIYLVDEQQNLLVPLAISPKAKNLEIYEEDMDLLHTEKRPLGRGIIGWVAEYGEPIRSGDVRKDERYLSVIRNIRSELCVPLIARGKVIGAINVETTQLDAYSQSDENLLTALANQASIAIGNAKLYQSAVEASERRAVLHSISQDVVRFTQSIDQIYSSIHEAASKLMICDVFRIALRNEATNENAFVYTMENGTQYFLPNQPASMGLTGKVVDSGNGLILHTESETGLFPRFGSENHVQSAVAVPLRIGGKVTGMISAQSYAPNSYGIEEQTLLEMLATHAATAIENTRLFNEAQQRLKELEAINRLSSSMRATQSQSEMCKILLDETLEIIGANNGSVWIYDSSINMIVQRAAKGVATKLAVTQLKSNEGIVGHVLSTGQYYIAHEMKSDPLLHERNRDAIIEGFGGAGIPIFSTDGIFGVLMVQIDSSRRVEDHINLLTTLAEIAGNAIHRADLYNQSQDQVRKLTTLRDIDSAIASSTDLRVTLNILMDHTIKHLKIDAVDISLYHSELQSLSYLCSSGFNTLSPSRPLARIDEGLAGQVIMNGKIVHIPNLKETSEPARNPLLLREGFISYIGVPLIVKGQIKGLFEIFNRSLLTPNHEWMQFMHTLTGQAAIAIDNSQLFDNLQRSNQDIRQAYDTTLEGWARALELRDRETEGHTRRVTQLTMRLAQYMNVNEDELININRGVLLHDIGKMGVPDQILRKTGPLSDTEWAEMRKHPQHAFDLLSPISYLRPALDIPYCHHEHWDGSGYPRGLKGDQIPLSARIFSIVDIWDALLSDRPYRTAWPRDKVFEYLNDISGTILDPSVVKAFLQMLNEDEQESIYN